MGIPVVTVTCDGQALDPKFEIESVEVQRELNRIPQARLTLVDGSIAKREFELSNSEHFLPSKLVNIAVRYEGEDPDATLFEGLVVRHTVELDEEGDTRLVVELKDKAFKLTRQRKSAIYREQTDDAAIGDIVSQAGLEVGELATTSLTHPELIQYYASDWDFIISRADVQGLVVDVHLGKLSMKPMALAGQASRKLELGLGDLSEFSLEIDATAQWAELESLGWDVAGQLPRGPEPAKQPEVSVGNLDVGSMARELGGEKCSLLHPVAVEQAELQAWADARLLRSRLAMLRGRSTIDGDPTVAPLDTVELVGIGDRFNGNALVSAVTHRIGDDGYQTELRLGLSPDWFARNPDIAEVPAGGLLPAVTNLQIAKVAPFEDDPLGEHRIKVQLPALDAQQGAVWARLIRPDAGQERGLAYWPEPDDEVVVGFLNGDPRQAVVLGALYGSVNAPPTFVGGPSDANNKRAIVSKSGIVIGFDDEKTCCNIESPAGNKILIDDHAKTITIADQHGNEITMSNQGVTLKSASDFTVDAAGTVTIKGSAVNVQ